MAKREDGIETFQPACWQAAFDTVAAAIAEGAPIVLVLAPAGYGKTVFLQQLTARLTAAGHSEEMVTVAPESAGEWLAPMLAALALSHPPLIAVDSVEKMSDAALRDLLLLATAPQRAGRPASVILAGEPDTTKRIERLLPARQARSLPRATLPAWSQDDVLGYLRARAAATGGQLVHVDAGAAARLVEITRGRPIAICSLVTGEGAAEGEGLRPWETRLTDKTPLAAAARLWPMNDGANGGAPKGGVAARGEVTSGLSDAALATVPAPYPLTGTTVGVIGIGGASRARSTSRLVRLAPVGLVVLSVVAAGWALWSERLPGAATDRSQGPRMAAALSPKDPLQETTAEPVSETAAPAATAAAEPPASPAASPAAEAPPAPAAPAPSPAPVAASPAPEAPPPPAASPRTEPAREPAPPAAGAAAPAVAPAPKPAPGAGNGDETVAVTPGTSGEIVELIARGDALLRLADLSAARQFYLLAARRGAAAGLTAAAGTYDPIYLRSAGVSTGPGDPRRAIELYRQAISQGDTAAAARLRALTEAQRQAGAIDAAEARRLNEP